MSTGQTLSGRVAIVTGGARGIGLAIVEELHRRGASILIADSGVSIAGADPDPSVAQSIAAKLGADAAAFGEDLSNAGAAARAVQAATKTFGAIDIVINNAAILKDSFIFKASRENWEQVIATNLTAPFALLAAATPLMREQQKNGRAPGRIVNIVSSAGLFGNFGQAAYASAKAGLVGLTRVVAMDMSRSKVTCNAIAPFAATRVTESIQPANDAQAEYKRRALQIPAHYVARLASFLSSNVHNLTGQLFGVRGRELLLFSQPRPVARTLMSAGTAWDETALAQAIHGELTAGLTDLATDLEFFNTEPIV
ncbi:MAG: SDR family NAD(P)-dependent oxidoreductase [Betaproteobacteria bacterium]|nr:SDR family NAD(P)-dependent oxidoreductase [Betaproteobacteria bacterium]